MHMYSIAAYVVSESIRDDVYIIDYFVPFVTDSKHIVSAIHGNDIWSYYNYNSECLLVPSVGCYSILCELSETGPWNSPSGDSTV